MGVGFTGATVGGPARVANAHRARERVLLQRLVQLGQLADGPQDLDAASGLQRQPSRVVPAIFEPPQPFDEERSTLPGPYVRNDTAHDGWL